MKALLLIAEILYTMELFTLLGVVIRFLKSFLAVSLSTSLPWLF